MDWQPLRLLREQFEHNLAALRSRGDSIAQLADPLASLEPSCEWLIAAADDRVTLARQQAGGSIESLPNPVSPIGASQIASKLFPTGKCTEPVFIAGLDQGWLWSALHQLAPHTPAAPGHTPPLYFVTRDLERLWAVMHVHDWRALLADTRVRLFAGVDAIDQAQRSMAENLCIPIPKLCVTVDPNTWTNGASIDTITRFAIAAASARMEQMSSQIACDDATNDPAATFTSHDRKLRVMGITSRFTTFLQYSMRDWLDAFASLGHETHLVIEQQACEQANPIMFADACATFRPDLIVMIDHFRGEYIGLPQNVPFVMWVQDQLPNIFSPRAGAAQKRYDYTIGYGREQCVYDHGYPSDRFLPVMVGTNEKRFAPRELTDDERARHTCDVSFVSHCSTPADELLQQEIARHGSSPETRRVFEITFEKLRARYDAGDAVTMPAELRGMVESSLAELKLNVDRPDALLNIFTHKINNALFRHQSLHWLAELAEVDNVRVHLYGRGWENHPTLKPFARGLADNETALSAIYQASKINLQISPFGSAHQRVFDGLCAGGFFLLRACPGDRCDRIYRELWNAIAPRQITTDAQLRSLGKTDAQVRLWLEEITKLNGVSPFDLGHEFVPELRVSSLDQFSRNAATLWDEYDAVAFSSREELHARVRRFLTDEAWRTSITHSMRERTIERMTYRAVAERTLNFVRDDLARGVVPTSQAA